MGCEGTRRLGEGQEECSASMSQWSRSTARPRPAASANRVGIISAREVASTGAASAQTIPLGETSAAVLVLSIAAVLVLSIAAVLVLSRAVVLVLSRAVGLAAAMVVGLAAAMAAAIVKTCTLRTGTHHWQGERRCEIPIPSVSVSFPAMH